MRRIGSILITAVAIASCVSTTVEEDAHNGQGEVSIKLRQDHSVTAVKTSEDLPDINDFIVEIEEMSTDRLFFRKTYAEAQGIQIPLNAGYLDAMSEGRTLEFFLKNQWVEKKEENYEFIVQAKKAAECFQRKLFLS